MPKEKPRRKAVILPLEVFVPTQQTQFLLYLHNTLGWNKLSLLWRWARLPTSFKPLERFRGMSLTEIFSKYQLGEYKTAEFISKMKEIFPNGNKASLKKAWNKMLKITSFSRNAFQAAKALVEQGIKVYLVGNTNFLHVKKIKEEYKAKYDQELPGEHYWSYEQGEMGPALLSGLLDSIDEQEVALFYSPPGREPGFLEVLKDPIKKVEHGQAREYTQWLENEAQKREGFKLVRCHPLEEDPDILGKLCNLWNVDVSPERIKSKTRKP